MLHAAVVTGASSGIGRATARRLGGAGFDVLAVGRDQAALASICREIEQSGARAHPLSVDVAGLGAQRAIVGRAMEAIGQLDAVVNAAGIISSGSVADTSDENWDAMLDVNVRAPFRLIREASGPLIERQGAVFNVSSVAG